MALHFSMWVRRKPTVNMKPDELILSYSLKLAWYIAFECSMWSKSPFMTACFGIPLGAVCSITVLSLLHAYPSLPVSAFLLTAFQDLPRKSPRMAPVVTIRDVTIESCHDGPREIQLMERLNTLFPEEEEIRSYQQEPEDPTSENGIFEERAKKSQLQAFAI
ncbi:hypothetical protein DL93DRAFT_2165487 [Clavulina sp. PMI_390]|nr:hypothetical protein DL93DRAFT_2165487 [Clavulina sp. PMI_390]